MMRSTRGMCLEHARPMTTYEVHVKQLPPQVVVTERCHTTLSGLATAMHSTLTKVATAVDPSDAARGAPFALYHNEPFTPDDIDVEMGLPITAVAKVNETAAVRRHQLDGGPVAYTMHVGPYASIGGAYAALFSWLEGHGHKRTGPVREIYLVGPGQGVEPAQYRTEIEVPID